MKYNKNLTITAGFMLLFLVSLQVTMTEVSAADFVIPQDGLTLNYQMNKTVDGTNYGGNLTVEYSDEGSGMYSVDIERIGDINDTGSYDLDAATRVMSNPLGNMENIDIGSHTFFFVPTTLATEDTILVNVGDQGDKEFAVKEEDWKTAVTDNIDLTIKAYRLAGEEGNVLYYSRASGLLFGGTFTYSNLDSEDVVLTLILQDSNAILDILAQETGIPGFPLWAFMTMSVAGVFYLIRKRRN